MKVVIPGSIPQAAADLLMKEGFKLSILKDDSDYKELFREITDADAVISLISHKFNPYMIEKMLHCKIIANYGVGFNNIDVQFAREKGIIVTNTPDVLTDSTADLAIALMLGLARRITEAENFVIQGKFRGWRPQLFIGTELKNKTFGVIGAGRIGTAAGIRAHSFGMKIIYYSKKGNRHLEKVAKAKKVLLNSLLKKADFISIHVPLTSETFHLLNKEKLSLIRPDAVLINTARGEIVDEKALIELLKQKMISSAGFDVYENEPNLNPDLFKLDNVLLLPHIGSATREARTNMALLAAKNVAAVLKGKKPLTPV
ncbi:MAG TPA: D-glycerate dehydrogenase [Ignavibacteriaceae bacterium]|nr:D-glycerate dehydrogenase [Ignavibacteriaceae bacterium]